MRPPVLWAVMVACLVAMPPVVLHAAITVTSKFAASVSSSTADFDSSTDFGGNSASVSIGGGALGIACVTSVDTVTPNTPILTQTGQTWTAITGTPYIYGPTSLRKWTAFYTVGTGSAASNVRIDHVDAQTGASMHIVELQGANTISPFLQTAVTTTTNGIVDGGTFTSTALSALTANSIVIFCVGTNQDRTWGIESGWTGIFLTGATGPIIENDLLYRVNGSDTTPSTTLTGGSTDAGGIAFEIAIAGAASSGGLLLGMGDRQ
jgi:hypothetical protein